MEQSKSLYLWLRDVHLYLGLFISPFILVFAISTTLFNHTWKPWDASPEVVEKTSVPVEIPADLEGIDQARKIMTQVGVTGEIQYLNRTPNHLSIPVMKPGQNILIEVDLENKTARVERHDGNVWDALLYLHKSPGPHNASIRGNWIYTRIWMVLADSVVYLLLFVSTSGVYLWTVIKAERKRGLVLLGGGCLSFLVLVLLII